MKNPLLTAIFLLALISPAWPQNLINNGDFTNGNVMSSGYDYVPYDYSNFLNTPQIFDGRYTVGPKVPPSYPDWVPFHTVSGGRTQMLIVNGAANPDESIWNQTVQVRPWTQYKISFSLAELGAPGSPADIIVDANNLQIGDAAAPYDVNEWKQYSFAWNSGASTTAFISLRDLNTSGVQNDFAIDNISMVATSGSAPPALAYLAGWQLLQLIFGVLIYFMVRRWTKAPPVKMPA
jgi:hypothetical protein